MGRDAMRSQILCINVWSAKPRGDLGVQGREPHVWCQDDLAALPLLHPAPQAPLHAQVGRAEPRPRSPSGSQGQRGEPALSGHTDLSDPVPGLHLKQGPAPPSPWADPPGCGPRVGAEKTTQVPISLPEAEQ